MKKMFGSMFLFGLFVILPVLFSTCIWAADYPNNIIKTIALADTAGSVDITPDGNYAYVTNCNGYTVHVIRISDNTVIKTITVGFLPYDVAITPNGAYAYVTSWGESYVSVIRTSDNTVTKTIEVGDVSSGVAITPNGNYVYVTTYYTDIVSVIRTSDNTVIKTINVGDTPNGVAVTPNGSYVYIVNQGSGTVSVIQTSDNTVINTIAVGGYPTGIAITPNGNYAYVVQTGNVSVIRTSDNTVIKTITAGISDGGEVDDIAITPDGNYVYVTCWLGGTAGYIIRTSDNTVIETIDNKIETLHQYISGIAITPDGNYAYVANAIPGNIFVFGKSPIFTLDINSTNPDNGVSITVTPDDNLNQGDGTTPFSRIYNENEDVTLTAPATVDGKNFQKWTLDGIDSTDNPIQVTMDDDYTITAIYALPANIPPNKPTNISPANGSTDVSIDFTLQSSAFSDPDAGDTHKASQWQVRDENGNYSSPVWDSGIDTVHKTSVILYAFDYSTTYYWHVRYQDNHDDWSEWSNETSFTTIEDPNPSPYCGDGTCNGTETCSSCPGDCGTCPTPPSDGGGGGGGGGCFIATACYGTPMAYEVRVLSRFRDECLLTNPVGKIFVNTYYKISPPIAEFIRQHPILKNTTREFLKPLIWIAKEYEN